MRVELPSGTPAELALPEGPAARGLVMYPDIHGLRPLFDDLAARLAEQQRWAVAVVEPFPGMTLASIDDRFAAVATLVDDRLLGDGAAAAGLLEARVGVERIAVMGFCMGGMYAYKAASTGRYDRAVSFYGMIRIPPPWRGPGHGEPLALLAEPDTCPVLAVIGEQDPYTPPDDVTALARFGLLVRTLVFPEAEHAFVHDPTRSSHRPDDAAVAWAAVYDFLA
jgi:dienelactone hydrolase